MMPVAALSLFLSAPSGTALAQSTFRNEVHRAQHTSAVGSKVVSKSKQPAGTPHKASSFAPHPTKQRVFGAPIQSPIMGNVPAPKKRAPK